MQQRYGNRDGRLRWFGSDGAGVEFQHAADRPRPPLLELRERAFHHRIRIGRPRAQATPDRLPRRTNRQVTRPPPKRKQIMIVFERILLWSRCRQLKNDAQIFLSWC